MTSLELLATGAAQLGYQLSPQQLRLFERYYQILMDWSRRLNLTAIVDWEGVQIKHFLDSLTVATALTGLPPDTRLLDVGTGAGLPGIPLKILLPDLRLVLLDSAAKKASFLRHLVSQLGLPEVEIATGRAEEVGHYPAFREQFGAVVSRAVAPLPALLELTLPFCRLGGIFIAQKKGDIAQEMERAAPALEVLGGQLQAVKKLSLGEAEERLLVVILKVAPTPPQYPRRPGVPSRRPIARPAPKRGRSETLHQSRLY